MLLRVITVGQHGSIAILLMDPRGIWFMKPNVFCKVFSTFPKNSKVSPARVHQQNSNVAVCDHCRATRQHCYFADGPSRDMAHETKCVPQSLFNVISFGILQSLHPCMHAAQPFAQPRCRAWPSCSYSHPFPHGIAPAVSSSLALFRYLPTFCKSNGVWRHLKLEWNSFYQP